MSPDEAAAIIRANLPPENYRMLRDALKFVLEHIDSQARQIAELKDLCDFKDIRAGTLLEQIEALKAGWIAERAVLNYIELAEGYDYRNHVILSDDDRSAAKKSLAAEHPELFSDPTKMMADSERGARP